jgi:hypothetical protein
MPAVRRNFKCPETDATCRDARCRHDLCAPKTISDELKKQDAPALKRKLDDAKATREVYAALRKKNGGKLFTP